MKRLAIAIGVLCVGSFVCAQQDRAQQLADEVWKASGGENWAKVKRLRWTFSVGENGKQLVSVTHHWDLAAGTDHVKWKDKDVTVNVSAPGESEDEKAACKRWVNDSYWLLAPLKIKDRGVNVQCGDEECETLRLNFENVGLTPNDQYVFYIDPQTKLLRAWDYIPKADSVNHMTWENYETVGGLTLATRHDIGGGKTITMFDIKVETGR